MATTPTSLLGISTFNGTSTYAADLQQAINHAVDIASIPLNELQSNVTTLQGQQSELTTLQTNFSSILTSIQNLTSIGGGSSLQATLSDDTVASATVDSSAAISAGTYTLNVISAGSTTTTLSNGNLPTVADPSLTSISASADFTLSVGGTNFDIKPATNTLNSLAQAINSSNSGVTATIVNIGAPNAPDYRLSLQSTALGDIPIQLNDGNQDLLSVLSHGSQAEYQVDGQPATATGISSSSSTVTIAPGVTVNLLQAGQTTISVAPDSSSAANSLSAFTSAYNAALAEIGNNHGTGGGALTGQSIIFQLQQSLSSLTHFTGGSGSVQSIADLGLTFNQQGQLSFDQAKFESTVATDPNDVATFLGTAASPGFLQNATNVLNTLEDPNTGIFQASNNSFQQQIASDNQEITDTQARITTMYNSLVAQMSQADAAIAKLQSQVSYFTTYFQDSQNALQFG